jgi:ABC-type glycerol-3-phosphate transport system permease component
VSASTGVSGPRSLPTTAQSERRQRIARTLTYSFLIAVAIVYIFPFVIAVVTSFKT